MVDVLVSKTSAFGRVGSNPTLETNLWLTHEPNKEPIEPIMSHKSVVVEPQPSIYYNYERKTQKKEDRTITKSS